MELIMESIKKLVKEKHVNIHVCKADLNPKSIRKIATDELGVHPMAILDSYVNKELTSNMDIINECVHSMFNTKMEDDGTYTLTIGELKFSASLVEVTTIRMGIIDSLKANIDSIAKEQ